MADRKRDNNTHNDEKFSSIPIDVLMEVFVRLPGKSLLRFKSVSKYWFSLIIHPVFVETHRTRSYVRDGGVVLVQVQPPRLKLSFYRRHPRTFGFFMIDPTRTDPMKRASVHDPSVPFTITSISNIVNGLICFYHRTDHDVCIFVYNFTTRENLPLPPPPRASKTCTDQIRVCHLGFDPINKVYKIFHVWCYYHEDSFNEVTVFTLGSIDNQWRMIERTPHLGSVWHWPTDICCSDGFLYWNKNSEEVILDFCVESEEFHYINHPLEGTTDFYLMQLRGQLSLVVIPSGKLHNGMEFHLWRLMDRRDNHRPIWSKEVLVCPILNSEKHYNGCSPFGLVSLVRGSPLKNDQLIIECFMLATGKHRQLKINNSQVMLDPGFVFSPKILVENIMPLTERFKGTSIVDL